MLYSQAIQTKHEQTNISKKAKLSLQHIRALQRRTLMPILKARSPKARDTASSPMTRLWITIPPASLMRSISSGRFGLWSCGRDKGSKSSHGPFQDAYFYFHVLDPIYCYVRPFFFCLPPTAAVTQIRVHMASRLSSPLPPPRFVRASHFHRENTCSPFFPRRLASTLSELQKGRPFATFCREGNIRRNRH